MTASNIGWSNYLKPDALLTCWQNTQLQTFKQELAQARIHIEDLERGMESKDDVLDKDQKLILLQPDGLTNSSASNVMRDQVVLVAAADDTVDRLIASRRNAVRTVRASVASCHLKILASLVRLLSAVTNMRMNSQKSLLYSTSSSL